MAVRQVKVGRPKSTKTEIAQNREMVLAAAERVYSKVAYSELSVDQIILEAEISRSTFYRWFAGKEEVIGEIVQRSNTRLLSRIRADVRGAATWQDAIVRGTDAYLKWGQEAGQLVAALYRDAHQPGTPAERDRRRLSSGLLAIYEEQASVVGQRPAHPMVYLSIFSGIEQAGSWYLSHTRQSAKEKKVTRDIMIRLALAMLIHHSPDVPELPLL